jgi:hypothetical protein
MNASFAPWFEQKQKNVTWVGNYGNILLSIFCEPMSTLSYWSESVSLLFKIETEVSVDFLSDLIIQTAKHDNNTSVEWSTPFGRQNRITVR